MFKWFNQWFSAKQEPDTSEAGESNRSNILERMKGETGAPAESPAPQPCLKEIALGGEVYFIEKKIGGGSYGQVYKARRQRDNFVVAIKEFAVNHAEIAVRFHREASILRELSHPNIVKVYQTGMVDLTGYLVMEFLNGWSLGKIMRKRESKQLSLPLTTFTGIIRQVTTALCALETMGAVHRDIKPDNILISPQGAAKLIDFGLLKAPGPSATLPDYILGTPNYISPEQVMGDKITIQADVYSLGATFYHMVTGQVPFTGDSPQQVMKKHVKNRATPPNSLLPFIPKKVSRLIMKMMEKKPHRRPNPSELLDMLDEVIDNLKSLKTKRKEGAGQEWT